jgi:hypothetical protein
MMFFPPFPMKLLQLKELNSRGYEVILVTSGAVGLGRQRLRYRRVANSRSLLFPFALTHANGYNLFKEREIDEFISTMSPLSVSNCLNEVSLWVSLMNNSLLFMLG